MNDPGMPISFSIPLDIPNIDVMFWMRQFTTDTLNTRYRVNYPFTSLYIQKVVQYRDRQAMDQSAQSMLSFCITQNNLDDVKNMFNEVSTWFTEENKKILYGRNDDGILMFNSDYQKLNAICVNEFGKVKTALKVVPTVVEVGNQVMEPGVVFYINLAENGIVLREYQIKRLCNFIRDFNFISYIQFAMQCFQYTLVTGAVLTREQVQQRLDAQRQYNTNIRF